MLMLGPTVDTRSRASPSSRGFYTFFLREGRPRVLRSIPVLLSPGNLTVFPGAPLYLAFMRQSMWLLEE